MVTNSMQKKCKTDLHLWCLAIESRASDPLRKLLSQQKCNLSPSCEFSSVDCSYHCYIQLWDFSAGGTCTLHPSWEMFCEDQILELLDYAIYVVLVPLKNVPVGLKWSLREEPFYTLSLKQHMLIYPLQSNLKKTPQIYVFKLQQKQFTTDLLAATEISNNLRF